MEKAGFQINGKNARFWGLFGSLFKDNFRRPCGFKPFKMP